MRRAVLSLLFVACAGCEAELEPPEILPDINPVYIPSLTSDPTAEPYTFDLQLTNNGEETLVIESVTYRGDQNCAFTMETEDPALWEIDQNGSTFVRWYYDRTFPHQDQIEMDVVSNASNYPTLQIAICGEVFSPTEPTDAGVETCLLPPADQPDCAEE
jgi:hypothetical protein